MGRNLFCGYLCLSEWDSVMKLDVGEKYIFTLECNTICISYLRGVLRVL